MKYIFQNPEKQKAQGKGHEGLGWDCHKGEARAEYLLCWQCAYRGGSINISCEGIGLVSRISVRIYGKVLLSLVWDDEASIKK